MIDQHSSDSSEVWHFLARWAERSAPLTSEVKYRFYRLEGLKKIQESYLYYDAGRAWSPASLFRDLLDLVCRGCVEGQCRFVVEELGVGGDLRPLGGDHRPVMLRLIFSAQKIDGVVQPVADRVLTGS
jgi:hypothetical protein